MTEGSMERANQAPTVCQLIFDVSVLEGGAVATLDVVLDRYSANPDRLQAIAKTPKAIDQRMDCCEEENVGSITKGKDNSASIDPTFEREYNRYGCSRILDCPSHDCRSGPVDDSKK